MEERFYVGLDIGTTKIACVVAEKVEGNKVKILGYSKTPSTGVKAGEVFNIQKTVDAIKTVVQEASDKSGVDIRCVSVGVAGHHIRSIAHHGTKVRSNDRELITRNELEEMRKSVFNLAVNPGEQIIDVIDQCYTVDYFQNLTSDAVIGMNGSQIEANYHVIIANIRPVARIKDCVRLANLECKEIVLEPIASANSVLSEEEIEAGVAIVDIGGGTTDIAVSGNGILVHTAVIPIAGNNITEDIVEGCGVIRKTAEEIKIKYGEAMPSFCKESILSIQSIRNDNTKQINTKNLSEIIKARLDEILSLVNAELEVAKKNCNLNEGIVLTGGGAMLKNIKELTEKETGLNVRIGYPDEHIYGECDPELKSPLYATVIGLIIESINREEVEGKEYTHGNTVIDEPKVKVEEAQEQTPESEPVVIEEAVKDEPKKDHRSLFKKITDVFNKLNNNMFDGGDDDDDYN